MLSARVLSARLAITFHHARQYVIHVTPQYGGVGYNTPTRSARVLSAQLAIVLRHARQFVIHVPP